MKSTFSNLLAIGLLAFAVSANAQSNLVLLASQPGDYIGQGQTLIATNTANYSVGGSAQTVSVSAFGYSLNFDAPDSAALVVGLYTNASRYPLNGGSPGLSVFGNGRACNTVCGYFQIFELATNASGGIDRLWLTFRHYCECSSTWMNGEVRFNSLLAPSTPTAKTMLVPAEYATIQSALDNASPYTVDTVLVSPGLYNEAINFKGKRARLLSAGGAGVTFIRAAGSTGVSFGNGENATALVAGFTITNCSTGVSIGGGASPTILSNQIVNCGTGINSSFSSPLIWTNRIANSTGNGIALGGAATPQIEGNDITNNARGIDMFAAGTPLIRRNYIRGNRSDGIGMVNQPDTDIVGNIICRNLGNGIYWLVPSGSRGPYVINNTIVGNAAAGISADGFDINSKIINNIVVGSPALNVGGFNDTNPPTILYNNFYSPTGAIFAGLIGNLAGVGGNISTNPFFACTLTDDYHLAAPSPCVDRATNGAPSLSTLDLDGLPRMLDGDTNGSVVADMGAFEMNPVSPPIPCIYVSCPANVVAIAPAGTASAIVNYPAPTGAPVATITSSPPSGSVFPAGTNIVTTTAAYGSNIAQCSFTVTVLVGPLIVTQPTDTNILAGRDLSLTFGTTGPGPIRYRWLFGNNTVPGANSPVLTINNIQSVNDGVYRAIASNSVGSVTSAVVSVHVLPSPPTIISEPASVTTGASFDAGFSVSAVGTLPLGYQWLFNGQLMPDTTPYLSWASVQSSNAGDYQVIITNSVGVTTSAVATLTVVPVAPYFIANSPDTSAEAGSSATFYGLANGSQPITYQWQRDGTNLLGATDTTLILSNLTLADSGAITLLAANSAGVSTSAVARLTVTQPPTIAQGLSNLVVSAGADVTLSVDVVGSPELAYSWSLNGQIIPGSNATLSLGHIQPDQAGFYRVVVANEYGSIASTSRVSVLGAAGSVIGWGDNSRGQTTVPGGLDDVVSVGGGDFHSVALRQNGTLAAWGYNSSGQTSVPTNVLRYVAVAAGAAHNLAILENGSVTAWGRNDYGESTVPGSTTNNTLAVAAGESHSLALLSSGTVAAWGDNSFGQVSGAASVTGVHAIAAGRRHDLALCTNGTVVGWGFNAYGQATPPAGLSNVLEVAAGYLHSAALLSNGTVVVWGDNSFGQTNVPAALSNVVSIAAGDFHTIARRADGSLIGWGDNTLGQTNTPPGLTNVLSVKSGSYHALAITPNSSWLQSEYASGALVLRWTGPAAVQAGPTPIGPFYDVQSWGRCYTNFNPTEPAMFFRLRR